MIQNKARTWKLKRPLAADLPREDHVYRTTDELFRFHKNKFDEMHCKLDYTESLRQRNTPY